MNHPVLENRVRFFIWWLAWLFIALGQSLLYYYAYGSFTNFNITDSAVSFVIFSVISLSLWYPFKYFNSGITRPGSLISNLLISGFITVSLWILITRGILLLIFPENSEYQDFWDIMLPYRGGIGVFIYSLVILTYYLFDSLTNLSEKKAKEARLESLIKETELKMLRSQINPHFLFNSLNSVSSLTITDPDKAREMVIKLSEFMRYALSKKDEQPVSLRSELENLRLYLDIEKVRFGDKLCIEEKIDPKCLDIKIPVMLLQPLYENAIKHGVYESVKRVNIITEAKFKEGILEIQISNNYDSDVPSAKGTGTGLANVYRRLELFYDKKAFIKTSKENGIYTVIINIRTE